MLETTDPRLASPSDPTAVFSSDRTTPAHAPGSSNSPANTDQTKGIGLADRDDRDRAARRAFHYLQGRLAFNLARSAIAESRLRLAIIAFCSIFFWATLFVFFRQAFTFLGKFDLFAESLLDYAFSMYFLSIAGMLTFSTGIIGYSSLFLARESEFLLTLPAPADRIFAARFREAMLFSCWGFILIGTPLLVAYGLSEQAGAFYYGAILFFLSGFVLTPGAIGMLGAFLVGYFLPRRYKTVLVLAILAVILFVGFVGAQLLQSEEGGFNADWLDSAMGRLAFSQSEWIPSVWITRGLMAAAEGEVRESLTYLWVTWANGGMAYLSAALAARLLYRPAFSRVQGGRSSRRFAGRWSSTFDRGFHRVMGFVSRPIRLLMLKDFRILRRDPAQWSQLLILVGLLGFYFLTMRRLGTDQSPPSWRSMLSFLNLAVTALLLSTFTSRFVYPLMSLEGRNFWVLGLFPVRRESILWGKFAFASGLSIVATGAMVVASDILLRVGPFMIVMHLALMSLICLGLAGISVGLGARFPNLRESDPSKIAAGFGGTLNLLLSLVFILLVVLTVGLPTHLVVSTNETEFTTSTLFQNARLGWLLGGALAASFIVGLLAVVLPMRSGLKAFRNAEL
mgnify:CR=1 FL=1